MTHHFPHSSRLRFPRVLNGVRGVGLGILTSVITLMASNASALQPYTATYKFTTNDNINSVATRVLTQKKDNVWAYAFNTRILAIGKASEASQFSFANNQVKSISHQMSLKIPFRNRQVNLAFTPTQLFVDDNGTKKTFPSQASALDDLNCELQIRTDLKNGGLKHMYEIAGDDGIEKVKMIEVGKEKVTTPFGTFDTIKVERVHSSEKRKTMFWLAPTLDYLPVRLSHSDKSLRFNMVLTQYQLPKS